MSGAPASSVEGSQAEKNAAWWAEFNRTHPPLQPKLNSILGIVGASGYMKNLGPGARVLSRNARANELLAMVNAKEGKHGPLKRSRLMYAIHTDNLEALREQIRLGAIHRSKIDEEFNEKPHGYTERFRLLTYAIEKQSVNSVRELLALGANPSFINGDFPSPLRRAILKYYSFRANQERILEIIQLLLEAGANVNEVYYGRTLLDDIQGGDARFLSFFLRFIDDISLLNRPLNSGGMYPLHRQIEYHSLACVTMLVEKGADLGIVWNGMDILDFFHLILKRQKGNEVAERELQQIGIYIRKKILEQPERYEALVGKVLDEKRGYNRLQGGKPRKSTRRLRRRGKKTRRA